VIVADACSMCGDAQALEHARTLRPSTDLCDRCATGTRPRRPHVEPEGCEVCRRRYPRRRWALGYLEVAGVGRWVCKHCYLERRNFVDRDAVLDGCMRLEELGELEHADVVALGRWAFRRLKEGQLARADFVAEAHRRVGLKGLSELADHFPAARAVAPQRVADELEEVVQVIESCLLAWRYRFGEDEFCSWRPIRNGLARFGLDELELIDRACERLGVIRKRAGKGERWRLP
jgi:hypothetical protein